MKDKFSYGLIIFVAFICGGLTMYYFSNNQSYSIPESIISNSVIVDKLNNSNKEVEINNTNLTDSIEKIYDAVVMVNNYKKDKVSNTGSGFVYKVDDKYGYIMTNHHVVEKGDKWSLYFSDDKEIDAELLGSDKYLDLAVLRVEKKYVKLVAKIGRSNQSRLGDTVFSIGSPLGYNYRGTVTNGIISGLNRFVEVSITGGVDDWVMEVIQTNTAVNPGNSGGPLVNANGEVIGVVSLKLVENAVEGMGFAIPIEDAMGHIDVLENGKSIDRPLLGISMMNLDQSVALKNDYQIEIDTEIEDGVVVVEISKGTGASKSNLKKGDVITKIGDEKVNNLAYLKYYLYKYNIGDNVELTYYRDGVYKTTTITLTKNNE